MLIEKLRTKNYKQDYIFEFKGEKYRTHSVVRLTEKGKRYLHAATSEVILAEQFTYPPTQKKCWKYKYRKYDEYCRNPFPQLTDVVTDEPPRKLIQEVVVPAGYEYSSREEFGVNSPVYTNGIKHVPKDWEISEVICGWIVFALVFLAIAIFRDWWIKAILRIVASVLFGVYRKAHIDARTAYTHPEDMDILRKKYGILYGIKFDNTEGEKK